MWLHDAHHVSAGVQARQKTRTIVWPSVHPVGVRHSELPVKGSRLQGLEPSRERVSFWWATETLCVPSTLCQRRIRTPTQKQEALSSTSKGRVAASAVGLVVHNSPESHLQTRSIVYIDIETPRRNSRYRLRIAQLGTRNFQDERVLDVVVTA
jgi:hypothetical protein